MFSVKKLKTLPVILLSALLAFSSCTGGKKDVGGIDISKTNTSVLNTTALTTTKINTITHQITTYTPELYDEWDDFVFPSFDEKRLFKNFITRKEFPCSWTFILDSEDNNEDFYYENATMEVFQGNEWVDVEFQGIELERGTSVNLYGNPVNNYIYCIIYFGNPAPWESGLYRITLHLSKGTGESVVFSDEKDFRHPSYWEYNLLPEWDASQLSNHLYYGRYKGKEQSVSIWLEIDNNILDENNLELRATVRTERGNDPDFYLYDDWKDWIYTFSGYGYGYELEVLLGGEWYYVTGTGYSLAGYPTFMRPYEAGETPDKKQTFVIFPYRTAGGVLPEGRYRIVMSFYSANHTGQPNHYAFAEFDVTYRPTEAELLAYVQD